MFSTTSNPPTNNPHTTNNLQPGTHHAKIISVAHSVHQENNYDIVRIDFDVDGVHKSKWYHLKTEKALKFFFKEMGNMGINPEDRDKLQETLDLLVDEEVMINVQIQTSGNPAIFINETAKKAKSTVSNPTDLLESS